MPQHFCLGKGFEKLMLTSSRKVRPATDPTFSGRGCVCVSVQMDI